MTTHGERGRGGANLTKARTQGTHPRHLPKAPWPPTARAHRVGRAVRARPIRAARGALLEAWRLARAQRTVLKALR